jgi:hypothetical protein
VTAVAPAGEQAEVPGLKLLSENLDESGPITVQVSASRGLVTEVMYWANIVFLAFIIFLILTVLLNVFIHVRVQHGGLVLQSLVVIALISSLLLSKLHFVERIATGLSIS